MPKIVVHLQAQQSGVTSKILGICRTVIRNKNFLSGEIEMFKSSNKCTQYLVISLLCFFLSLSAHGQFAKSLIQQQRLTHFQEEQETKAHNLAAAFYSIIPVTVIGLTGLVSSLAISTLVMSG